MFYCLSTKRITPQCCFMTLLQLSQSIAVRVKNLNGRLVNRCGDVVSLKLRSMLMLVVEGR